MQGYFWTKTFHLVFVIAWMATVFYLPRILVNIAEAGDAPAVRDRLVLMGRRLYRFGHVVFGIALVFGLALWLHYHMVGGWLHAKLALVVLLIGYHAMLIKLVREFARDRIRHSSRWLRLFNEVPALLLVAIVLLVVVKPF